MIRKVIYMYKDKLRNYKETDLGKEIKKAEFLNERYLNENEYHFIRCDGRHFKSFCKKFKKPFDEIFRNTMSRTMIALCEEIQGSLIGFTQSDEITIMFKKTSEDSELFFSGRVSKIETSASSSCTLLFNKFFMEEVKNAKEKLKDEYIKDGILSLSEIEYLIEKEFSIYKENFMTATFDAKVFSRPNLEKAQEVFIWRILDCYKNAVQMVARTIYSNKQLEHKKLSDMKAMLLNEKIDIDHYPLRNMYGIAAIKEKKILYQGTKRECIRKKFTLKNSLEVVFDNMKEDNL